MEWKNLEHEAELFKVLANPVRLCILIGLMREGHCQVSVMQECLSLPQSTVSQHIGKLRSAGIIHGERKGTQIYYQVVNEKVKELIKIIMEEK